MSCQRLDAQMNAYGKSTINSLLSTSWMHAASPHGRWVDINARQVSHSIPKCPIANMYLVLGFQTKSMLRFNVIIAFQLPRLRLLTCCYWVVCCCLFVRSSEGTKRLQMFELPPSQKILELPLTGSLSSRSCNHISSCSIASNGYTWEDNIVDGICCIMLWAQQMKASSVSIT